MAKAESSNKGEHLNIFFTDLTLLAQSQVLEHYKVQCPTQLNADVFPLCTVPYPEQEEEVETMVVRIELKLPSKTHYLHIEPLGEDGTTSTTQEFEYNISVAEIVTGRQEIT